MHVNKEIKHQWIKIVKFKAQMVSLLDHLVMKGFKNLSWIKCLYM